MVFLPDIQDDPRQRRHELLPATLGESIKSAFTEGAVLGRPGDAIARRRQEEILLGRGDDFLGMLPIQAPQVDPGRMLSPQEATRRFPGITFDEPVPEKLAVLRAQKKQAEIRRRDILARGPQGVLPTTLQFGAMFVSAILDPVNIAASFVPVVGQTRFASLLARLGPTRARATRGAIEGTVGNALVEPVIAAQAFREQLDYTMVDSLVNVAFGGLIGGGLHVGAGKISDLLSAQTPEARVAALRTSTSQFVGDRRVNVEPVFDGEQVSSVRVNDVTVRAAAENDTVMVVSLESLVSKASGVPEPAKSVQPLEADVAAMRVERSADGKLSAEPNEAIAQLRARGSKTAAISVDRNDAREIASILGPEQAQRQTRKNARPTASEQKRIVEDDQDIDEVAEFDRFDEPDRVEGPDKDRQREETEGLDEFIAQAETEGIDPAVVTRGVDETEAEFNNGVDAAVRCLSG